MQIKTNKHHCVCELKLHIMLYQFTEFAAISPFCTTSAAGLCVITGHFVVRYKLNAGPNPIKAYY